MRACVRRKDQRSRRLQLRVGVGKYGSAAGGHSPVPVTGRLHCPPPCTSMLPRSKLLQTGEKTGEVMTGPFPALALARSLVGCRALQAAEFFIFQLFFLIFTNRSLMVLFLCIDPDLGAKETRLGAIANDAEVLARRRTWR